MKKHFIAFMMPFLTLATGFAQEAAQDVPVKQDTKEISYWTDPASGDKRLLNKSKFRDNWFVGLQAGAFYSWGTHTSSSGFFDQFRPAGALSIGSGSLLPEVSASKVSMEAMPDEQATTSPTIGTPWG